MATTAETLAKLTKLQALSDFADKVNAKFAAKATTLAGYGITDAYTSAQTDTKISEAVAAADHMKRKIVTATSDIDLTAADASQYIYMVQKGTSKTGDKYDEYMVLDGALEKVGDWEVDLSDYAKTADVNTSLAGKVDKVDGSRLMTETEGTKLASLENYTHPVYEAADAAFIKVGRDATGHVVTGAAITKDDITALGIPAQDTTYSAATTTADGLMSAADKTKLDGIEIATDDEVTTMLDEKFGA